MVRFCYLRSQVGEDRERHGGGRIGGGDGEKLAIRPLLSNRFQNHRRVAATATLYLLFPVDDTNCCYHSLTPPAHWLFDVRTMLVVSLGVSAALLTAEAVSASLHCRGLFLDY